MRRIFLHTVLVNVYWFYLSLVGPSCSIFSRIQLLEHRYYRRRLTSGNRHILDELEGRKESHGQQPDSQEPWRYTPLLDNNTFAFSSFSNQHPGYYTPTPGGSSTLYHSRAGDLHTPGMGFHLGTPLSMPMADANIHSVSGLDMHAFQPNVLSPFQPSHTFPQQQSYAPSSFVHQDSGFETMEVSHDATPKQETPMSLSNVSREKSLLPFTIQSFDPSMSAAAFQTNEK